MTKKKPIGGFFEFEITSNDFIYHTDALALTNGRACMAWILQYENPTRVYVPFYTCDALFQPIIEKGIDCKFYRIDEQLNPMDLPELQTSELLVIINYYGLKLYPI